MEGGTLFRTAAVAVEVVSDGLGVVAIIAGLVAVVGSLTRNAMSKRSLPGIEPRIGLGRWLALSLELTLAGDIVGTIVAPSWEDIGKVGAIIVLRTVLNYFLGKEVEHAQAMAERQTPS
jgi:uncharacterized membrane protein